MPCERLTVSGSPDDVEAVCDTPLTCNTERRYISHSARRVGGGGGGGRQPVPLQPGGGGGGGAGDAHVGQTELRNTCAKGTDASQLLEDSVRLCHLFAFTWSGW